MHSDRGVESPSKLPERWGLSAKVQVECANLYSVNNMNVDRYITIMLASMYPKHKASITTVQFYDEDKARVKHIITIQIISHDGTKTKTKCYSKRQLIQELIKWQGEGE